MNTGDSKRAWAATLWPARRSCPPWKKSVAAAFALPKWMRTRVRSFNGRDAGEAPAASRDERWIHTSAVALDAPSPLGVNTSPPHALRMRVRSRLDVGQVHGGAHARLAGLDLGLVVLQRPDAAATPPG